MKQVQHSIHLRTEGKGLYDVSETLSAWVAAQPVHDGLLTVFIRHTSASLVIQENADPAVLRDLDAFLTRLVAEDPTLYEHRTEGPDDMPAHIRSALTQTHLAIPVRDARMALGTWQGVYLFEHRAAPHDRELLLHLIGEEYQRS